MKKYVFSVKVEIGRSARQRVDDDNINPPRLPPLLGQDPSTTKSPLQESFPSNGFVVKPSFSNLLEATFVIEHHEPLTALRPQPPTCI
jgi:hypothetical protein